MKSKKVLADKNNHESHNHPDHRSHLKQLARVKGQVEGVEKMIQDGRYCIDIINQLKAVSAGLKVIESAIFEGHLKSCVVAALSSNNNEDIQIKINEINKLVYGSKSKR
ncbi:MAG: metal-sensitive transcriptional regulator [Bacteriovorax sp.]|nr:metal-sensitive transcriptional regulator [Bacteriovorax sp.]